MYDLSYPICRTLNCRTQPEPGYADRGLCTLHEALGLEAVEHLYDDWLALQGLIWDKPALGLRPNTGPVPYGPTDPLNEAIEELAGELAYTAVLWEIPVRDRAGLSEPPRQHEVPSGRDLQRATRTLAAHYSVLVALGPTDYLTYGRDPATADGPDAIVTLTRLHHRAAGATGNSSPVFHVPGICPNCGLAELRHPDGTEDVRCRECRVSWPWNAYQDYIRLMPLTPSGPGA